LLQECSQVYRQRLGIICHDGTNHLQPQASEIEL